MVKKVNKTVRVLETQDEWIRNKAEELDVDQSVLVRRAITYYKKRGINQDKYLKKMAEGEI